MWYRFDMGSSEIVTGGLDHGVVTDVLLDTNMKTTENDRPTIRVPAEVGPTPERKSANRLRAAAAAVERGELSLETASAMLAAGAA